MASRTLFVMPDATAAPLVAIVASASRTIRVKMFVFTDPSLLDAVIAAKKRGVDVRVMLNAARRSGESDNDESRKILEAAGVTVKDANPTFDLTHEKSLVVDDTQAVIMSLNWETRNVTDTRDYAVVTDHRKEVSEVLDCFDADWERTEFKPHVIRTSSGAMPTGANASRISSIAPSANCGCRTNATRTLGSSSGWCALQAAA